MKQINLIDEIIVDCFAGGITVASLFDGIGGTPLSARINGAECLWCSEIEKFPQMVTKHHFPNMKHYGDITKINGAEVEPVDIIVGGSPCQDLSVAGKRAGMKHADFGDEEGTRSGLFMEQIRIIKEMRHASDGGATTKPRFMVWENVPGAFSSNKGEDFRIVLEETARIKDKTVSIPRPNGGKWSNAGVIVGDGFSIAWRTVDAQFWGVAQRRRRIYLVADFGGQSAPEILFEREGMPGDITESRSKGQGTSGDVERCSSGTICFEPGAITRDMGVRHWEEISPTLTARMGTCGNQVNAVCSSVGGFMQAETERAPTLMATDYKHVVSQQNKQVRRLTPLECERLQGYPDGWTNIPGASDSARYKALGNSFAIPNASFVIGRCITTMREFRARVREEAI